MESLMLNNYYSYICEIPEFLKKYLNVDIFLRLKNVSYFCGMDYASKDIYNFKFPISRYEHSISTALFSWKFTHDKAVTIAALFHDVSAPCFSHVIDYMNGDYVEQSSTEEKTAEVLCGSKELRKCLDEDNINIEDIIRFDKYPIVDTRRPKLCADRLDGIFLPSFSWTKSLTIEESKKFIDDLEVYINEDGEKEIGFKTMDIALEAVKLSDMVNVFTHTKEDKYMMQLCADVMKMAINKKYITYNDLYYMNEKDLVCLLNKKRSKEFLELWNRFKNMKKEDVPKMNMEVKNKILKPIVDGVRMQ